MAGASICIDVHAYCHRDLWLKSLCFIDFIWHMTQGSVSGGFDPIACTNVWTPHPHAVDELTSWEKKDRHNSTQNNMFFSGLFTALVFILQLFGVRPYPMISIRITALSLDGIIITRRLVFYHWELNCLSYGIKCSASDLLLRKGRI